MPFLHSISCLTACFACIAFPASLPALIAQLCSLSACVRSPDVFDLHRDAKLPNPQGLVVAGRHEPAVVVDEGDGVDCAQVLVVLLRAAMHRRCNNM